jgi:predicted ferric reductase
MCAAAQTANVKPSRLLPGFEAHCAGCWLCLAESPAVWKPNNGKVHSMLYTIAVVLLVLWLLGLVTSYTLGGFIHILLVVAVIMILLNLISGRRAL